MSQVSRVAVVTGANRGIGLETCRQLAEKGLQVVLTSRNETEGHAACDRLRDEGLKVAYHPLDVTDDDSIKQLRDTLARTYSRLDVLINNAAIHIDNALSVLTTDLSILENTLETNVRGPFALCKQLIPLMQAENYGRVVNVSSGAGQLYDMRSGYPAYRMSKAALNALTRILASEMKGTNIIVNSVCPGWVKTEMGGANAPRDVEEGADTIVWLATLPDGAPSGIFFRDRQP
ncbi:MAG: SDR family oxidoreductase, partial [Cyanobacteria bacterium J06648_11]